MVFLGIDLGQARTGVSACDAGERFASPVTVIAERDRQRLCEKLCALAKERGAQGLVVGLPKNMDGSEGASAKEARAFAGQLGEAAGLPVTMQDERGTTLTAHAFLNATDTRGKKRKAAVDAVAAVIILEDFLQARRLAGKESV